MNGNGEVDSKISALSNLNRIDNISVLRRGESVVGTADSQCGDLFSGSGSRIEYGESFSDFADIKSAVSGGNKVSPSGRVEVGNVDRSVRKGECDFGAVYQAEIAHGVSLAVECETVAGIYGVKCSDVA